MHQTKKQINKFLGGWSWLEVGVPKGTYVGPKYVKSIGLSVFFPMYFLSLSIYFLCNKKIVKKKKK